MDTENNTAEESTSEKSTPKKITVTEHEQNPANETVEADIVDDENEAVEESEVASESQSEDTPESSEEVVEANVSVDDEETSDTIDDDSDADKPESTDEEIDPSKTIEELASENDEAQSHATDIFPPDPDIDAVVDDIVRAESDESIKEADAKLAALEEQKNKRTVRQKIAAFFAAWWNNKSARYITIVVLLLGLAATALIPSSRYALLNLVGVRVSSSLTVIDAQTRLPLKNISVDLQDKNAKTDDQGAVTFNGLKLGSSKLKISKIGYADNERTIVLGWGSNPIGEQELVATGEQFTFIVRDWLSDEPLTTALAESGESSAKSDESGKIILTVGEEGIADAVVKVRADGYREETYQLSDLNEAETQVKLVPSRRHAFVSNRDGTYDLYTIDVDGKNEKLLIEATEKEREVPTILSHPTRDLIAFISSRGGEQNKDGYVLDELFLVDTNSGEYDRIGISEQMQLVGWHEDTLVFWQVIEGTSRANAERSKLISYNERTGERKELAGANYFNDVRMVNGLVYYAVSSFAVPQSQAKLYTINTDGSNRIRLIDELVYSIYRTSYDTLLFAADNQKWFQEVGRGQVTEVGPQSQPQNRRFMDSPNGERTVWVEIRDGRGVLLMKNLKEQNSEETRVLTLAGLDSTAYWLNNHTLVFRVIRAGETADYVINVDKPAEIKIVDVTASTRLYY